MYHLRHQKYKIEHTEVKYLNSILKNRILKVKKNILLELEKYQRN